MIKTISTSNPTSKTEFQNFSKVVYFLIKTLKSIDSLDKQLAKKIVADLNYDQELIDYLNSLLTGYDNSISQEQQTKSNLDQAIDQQENNIVYFEEQKIQCDANIAIYDQDKVYVNELIVIVEAT